MAPRGGCCLLPDSIPIRVTQTCAARTPEGRYTIHMSEAAIAELIERKTPGRLHLLVVSDYI
jgi:hypothetical protein